MTDTISGIRSKKIITICRRLYGDDLLRLAEALHKAGICHMEVTFDQSDSAGEEKTARAISALDERFGGEMEFGAGTVLTERQVQIAKEAGAKFIISPNVNDEVIRTTLAEGLISIPGAMTPSEILHADRLGAQFVKLFPAGTLGLKYLKDVRAPISHVSLLATGGITEDNFGDFLAAGAAGAGISGRLTDKKCIEAGSFEELTRRARAFMDIAGRY